MPCHACFAMLVVAKVAIGVLTGGLEQPPVALVPKRMCVEEETPEVQSRKPLEVTPVGLVHRTCHQVR